MRFEVVKAQKIFRKIQKNISWKVRNDFVSPTFQIEIAYAYIRTSRVARDRVAGDDCRMDARKSTPTTRVSACI